MPGKPRKQRCTALTGTGRHCRNYTSPGYDRCAIHALNRPAATGRSRCTARRPDGARCTQWAAPGTNPPRCHTHRPGSTLKPGGPRRCTARTRAGTRCRNWTTAETQHGASSLCHHHQAGQPLPRADDPGRCTAITATGRRCKKWALRPDSQSPHPDPRLCAVHAGLCGNHPARPADYQAGRVCTATTVTGRRCKKWALAHTDPPLCWIHAYPDLNPSIRHGYLRRTLFLPDPAQAHIHRLATNGPPLAAEIALLRLKVRALLAYLGRPGLSSARWLAAYRLLQRALPLVARLVQTQHALAAEDHTPEQPPLPGATLNPTAGGWLNTVLAEIIRQEAQQETGHDH